MKGASRDVLFQIECWLRGKEDKHSFRLSGLTGTGKFTIAQAFTRTSFFSSLDFDDRNHLRTTSPSRSLTAIHAFGRSYFWPRPRAPTLEKKPFAPKRGNSSSAHSG